MATKKNLTPDEIDRLRKGVEDAQREVRTAIELVQARLRKQQSQ